MGVSKQNVFFDRPSCCTNVLCNEFSTVVLVVVSHHTHALMYLLSLFTVYLFSPSHPHYPPVAPAPLACLQRVSVSGVRMSFRFFELPETALFKKHLSVFLFSTLW